MKILYIDTETTGLDPKANDIIQISGLVEIDGNIEEEFDIFMQPYDYSSVSQQALAIHGNSIEKIKTFQEPHKAHTELINLFSKYVNKFSSNKSDKFVCCGQNVRFDMDFMRQFFVKSGDPYFGSWFDYHCIDLMALTSFLKYAGVLNVPNLKLETVAKHFGHEFNAHSAIDDIRMTRQLIKELAQKFIKFPD